MAEVTRERTGEIIRAVFEILMDHPDGIQAREAIALAKNRIQLTDFELGEYSNSSSVRFDKILRFSTIGPTKAGWMTKTKGIWRITEDGRTAYSAFGDPGDFMREASRLYLGPWKRAQPSERMRSILKVLTSQWRVPPSKRPRSQLGRRSKNI